MAIKHIFSDAGYRATYDDGEPPKKELPAEFRNTWPCCSFMKTAVELKKVVELASVKQLSILCMSGDKGESIICEIDFCPWCGANLVLRQH